MIALTDITPLPRQALQAELNRGALLLTATNRLARHLRADFDRRAARQSSVWTSPRILPWSAWLHQEYLQLLDLGLTHLAPLSQSQERLLWEHIIRESDIGARLLQPAALAETAISTARLMIDWQIPEQTVRAHASDEAEAFLAWREQFHAACANRKRLAMAEIPAQLLTNQSAVSAPPGPSQNDRTLILAGFDELNPLQGRLLAGMMEDGSRLLRLADPDTRPSASRVSLLDAADELHQALHWAARRLQANPAARIGIVVPDLAERRLIIERQCLQTLQPGRHVPGNAPVTAPFELSAAPALAEFPLVADALLALRLAFHQLELADISRLSRSPYFLGGAEEWAQRGQLEAALRRDGRPELDLPGLSRRANDFRNRCPRLHDSLLALKKHRKQLPGRATPSVWAGHFDAWLKAWGWARGRPLDSPEQQTRSRLRDLFGELASLDDILTEIPGTEALSQLRRLATETRFQPEHLDAPIQLLGLLESGGLDFDHLWVTGLCAEDWPPPARPNPLLPAALQRELGLPHADAGRELGFARTLTQRLRQSAGEVVFSWPRRDGDKILTPSPLLLDLAESTSEQLGLDDAPRAASGPLPNLETLDDHLAPPADGDIQGGSALLADQAACPFRAFANHRLRARPLDEPGYGIDPRLAGQLVHRVLELAWTELGDSRALAALSANALRELIEQCAQSAVAEAQGLRPDLFQPRLATLQRELLTRLTGDWLTLEGQRQVPFTVERPEQLREVELAGLPLRLQADRIDRLADGRLLVIDYKTGKASPRNWDQDRPDEPQVPLYCITELGETAGALIAKVRADGMRFVGRIADPDLVPAGSARDRSLRGEEDWPALIDHWRQALTGLAGEILAGEAAVRPQAGACDYCALPSLCRIQSASAEDPHHD